MDTHTHQAAVKSRCSPKGIEKIMKDLKKNDELMKAIEDMGFGSIKHLPAVKMEHKYIKKLVDSFDIESCSLCGVAITAGDVGDILGVQAGGKLIPAAISNDDHTKFKGKYDDKNFATLKKDLIEFEKADLHFKETFMLCAFGMFYCPSTKDYPSQNLYKALSVLPSPKEYNWGKFILDVLLEAINDYKKRAESKEESSARNIGMGGCTYFLKVFSLQKLCPLTVESGKPLMSAWTAKQIKSALKMKRIEKAKGSKKIKNDNKGNKKQFVNLSRCISIEQRLARLETIVLHQNTSSDTAGIERLARFEERLAMLEKAVSREYRSTDEEFE